MWDCRHCRGRLGWNEHVIKGDEGELIRELMQWRDQKSLGVEILDTQGDWNKVDMEWDIDGEEMKDQWIISRIPEVAVVVEFVEHLNTPPPSEPATNVVLSSWENERQVTRKYKLYIITPATSSVNGGVYCTCVWINVYFPTHYKIQILHSTLPIRVFQWLVTLWIDR
jgi:hypothetical protein